MVATSSGLAIKSRESEAAMPYFADFGIFQCLILQIFELSNALFCILWPFIEAVDEVRHDVAGKGVAVCLGAALGVEDLGDVAEVAEDVEGIEGEGEAGLGEGLAEAGVPYEVVGVGGAAGVSAAAVHGEVGGELEAEGQVHERGDAVVEVVEREGFKIGA